MTTFVSVIAILLVTLPIAKNYEARATAMKEARALLETGEVDAAREYLQNMLEKDPRATDVYLLLAQTHLSTDPAKARDMAGEILSQESRNGSALDLLSLSYERLRALGISAHAELVMRRRELADYDELLAREPDWTEALYRSASHRLAIERLLPAKEKAARLELLNAAVEALEKTQSLSASSRPATIAGIHYQLGRALKHLGDFEQSRLRLQAASAHYERAFKELRAALSADPERIDAAGEIVLIHQQNDDQEKALEELKAHLPKLSRVETRAKLRALIGNLQVVLGQSSAAITSLEAVMAEDPSLPDPYLGLANIYQARDDRDALVRTYTRATVGAPTFIFAHLQLGRLAYAAGEYDKAIEHFHAVGAIPPERAVVVGMLPSRNLYRNGLYREAAQWLAWLYIDHAHDPVQASSAVTIARRWGADDESLADTEAWINFHRGEFDAARGHLEALQKAGKASATAKYHLAATYAKLGQNDDARAVLDALLSVENQFPERDLALALRNSL